MIAASLRCPVVCFTARVNHAPIRSVQRSSRALMAHSTMRDRAPDMSDEWAVMDSLASRDDMLMWYNHQHESRKTRLHDVMQTNLVLTSPEASLGEVVRLLDGPPAIEGMPVVDADSKLVGVISRKDLAKPGSRVKDVMTATPVALKASSRVSEAAKLMIKHKIHRVPVVGDDNTCIGIVTRSNIFWALTQSAQEGNTFLSEHGLDL